MAMQKFRSPPLPVPPAGYDQQYITQLIRVLGLYFRQLDSLTPLQADYFWGSGRELRNPHIAASDSTDQYAGGNDTITVVKWNTLDSGLGFTLSAPGSATADYAGIYKITFSLQFVNTANTVHDAVVWLRVNGADIANSTTSFSIPARKSTGVPSYLCGYSEVVFEMAVGDTMQLMWATDQAYSTTGPVDGVYIYADVAQTSPYARPAIPSALGSITFVSAVQA